MTLVFTALGIGALIGLVVGWRAGRLHLSAYQHYYDWRGAVDAVPVAYRSAMAAIRAAVGYVLGAGLVVAIALAVIWAANRD